MLFRSTTGGGEKPAAKHDDDDYYMHHGHKIHSSEVAAAKAKFKRRKLSTKAALDMIANTRRMAAAKHATSSAVGGGKGSSNASPLDKAISKISDKPKKGAGASPAELDAAKAEKKAAEKKPKSDDPKRLTGKVEEGVFNVARGVVRSAGMRMKSALKQRYTVPKSKKSPSIIQGIKRLNKLGAPKTPPKMKTENAPAPTSPAQGAPKYLAKWPGVRTLKAPVRIKPVQEELNTDMLDKHDGQKEKNKEKKVDQKTSKKMSKLKYKYHKRTATGEKTHKVIINPEIDHGKS